LAFHCAPFADATRLRASWGAYEARFRPESRSEPTLSRIGTPVRTLVPFGPSDHVVAPDFDRMGAIVFPDHVGPFLLRDCGHFVPWESPHASVSSTAAFCADLLVRNGPAASA
jgi:pimeloyl-ACP methyl ester carboxylesterase